MNKICENCFSIISSKYGNKFCSKSCSVSFNNSKRLRSEQTKINISNSMKKYIENNREKVNGINASKKLPPHTKIIRINCKCCFKLFWSGHGRICCSSECARSNSTYRKIIHEYEHNGVILKLESSWEVEIAKYLDHLGISWIRPNHLQWVDSKGKKRKYFPDFYLIDYDVYLDPKNEYQIKIGKEKLDAIRTSYTLYYGSVEYLKDILHKEKGEY